LHLGRVGPPLVLIVERGTDAVAEKSADRSPNQRSGSPIAGAR
jgi:hypothetical protein